VTSHVTSEGVTPPSSLLRAYAPDHGPPHASVAPRSWGLCRLSRVPAGLWPFPTLSLPSVCGCVDPYPAVFVRCTCPSLPQRQRPHVTGNTFGTRENPCKAISTGSRISGLQSFAYVHAPTLARPPDRSHRSRSTGRPGRLHHAWPEGLPTSGCGIATCLHGHLTRLDLHQLDGSLVGCSLPHTALRLVVSSSGLARLHIGFMQGEQSMCREEGIRPALMVLA
jgi:hypothetical protein